MSVGPLLVPALAASHERLSHVPDSVEQDWMWSHRRAHTYTHTHSGGFPVCASGGRTFVSLSRLGGIASPEELCSLHKRSPTSCSLTIWAGMTVESMTLLTGTVSKPGWQPQCPAVPWTNNVWCSVLLFSAVDLYSPFWYWALFTSCYTTVEGTSILYPGLC